MTMLTDAAPAAAEAQANDATAADASAATVAPAEAAATDGSVQGDQVRVADGKPQEQAKPEGAPESYDWKLEEGISIDDSGLNAFSAWAKENNLTQDQANGLLNKMAAASAERQSQAFESTVNEWISSSKSDSEIGGPDLQKNLAVAKTAMEKFGTPELTKLLNESGLGNHPEIIRAFYRAGKAISEDRFVGGGRVPSASADPAKRLFPTMN